jgi:broad specificity phosphatase PhoE
VTTIHIVRHGETIWHKDNRYAGRTDVALTETGATQGVELVPWATTAGVDRVISSDLLRAIATAQPIADALTLPLVVDPRLREVDFGEGEGLTVAEMVRRFPAERAAFDIAPASNPLPGGESGVSAVERALPAVAEAMAPDNVNTVLLVIHSTLGRLLLCEFLGIDKDNYRRIFPTFINGAVTTVRFPSFTTAEELRGRGALLQLNAKPH